MACPDRKVVALEADGSAMYTLQALWTQAREGLDVTTVVFNNRSYAILNLELSRVGAEPGPKALDMLDLSRPDLDFVALATGMGVPATRATTAEELATSWAGPWPSRARRWSRPCCPRPCERACERTTSTAPLPERQRRPLIGARSMGRSEECTT